MEIYAVVIVKCQCVRLFRIFIKRTKARTVLKNMVCAILSTRKSWLSKLYIDFSPQSSTGDRNFGQIRNITVPLFRPTN